MKAWFAKDQMVDVLPQVEGGFRCDFAMPNHAVKIFNNLLFLIEEMCT
jgi:hypothetical protein